MTSGRTGTVKVFGANRSDVPPRDPSTRLPRARTFYIVLYILSLPSPFCQFCSPLIFRPFSAPTLLRAAPSPRRPSLSPRSPLALPSLSPRSPFASLAQPSLPSPYSSHPPHPFDSFSKENHSRSKETSERFVRKEPFKTVTFALQTACQSLRNSPQKQKKRRFSQIF